MDFDHLQFRDFIHANLVTGMKILIEAMEVFKICYSSQDNEVRQGQKVPNVGYFNDPNYIYIIIVHAQSHYSVGCGIFWALHLPPRASVCMCMHVQIFYPPNARAITNNDEV